ncbi:PaaX family transcriptional regulator C-terminal domain-containing protein [Georgenia sp. Z1491]|uniref:PaaX family transcriptional regulator C-terminal domain-containing protein n=1 Tax=Georgenia sp. Z1491 TaxID=3416707 RepID=UPI003CE8468B
MSDRRGLPAQRAPSIASLISFLFGLSARDSLPGPALVALLADLGIGASATRSAIARMRAAGEITGARTGRITDYRLAGLTASGFRHARSLGHPGHGPAEREWTGEFAGILYSAPERLRNHRDRLRTKAVLAGYATLRPGLLIGVDDRWETLEPFTATLPEAMTVYPVTLRLRPAEARAAAAEAWELASLDRHLGRQVTRLSNALARDRDGRPTGAAAMRRLAGLTLPVYRALVVVPPLPAELLPEGWRQPELTSLLGQVHEVLGPPARRHLDARLSEAG